MFENTARFLFPLALAGSAFGQCGEAGELIPVPSIANQSFGFVVDATSTHLLVGTGAKAYVFDAQSLLQLAAYEAPPNVPGGPFADVLAASEQYLVIGASGMNNGEGAAYVFDLTTYQDLGELAPTAPPQQVGYSVAVHRSVAAVAQENDGQPSELRIINIYSLGDPSTWVTRVERLEDYYGDVLALDGEYLAVSGNQQVHLYETTGYSPVGVIEQQAGLGFIESLAILDGRVYVGSTSETVMIFEIVTQDLVDTLTPSYRSGALYGMSVATTGDSLVGGRIAVGQPGEGTCYVYDAETHSELRRYVAGGAVGGPVDGNPLYGFGRSVSLAGDRLLEGSLRRVVHYDLTDPCSLTTYCYGDGSEGAPCLCGNESAVGAKEGCRNSTGIGATMVASGSTSIVSDDLQFTIEQGPAHRPGLLVQGATSTANTFFDGVFCMGAPTTRLEFVMLNSQGTGITQSSIAADGGVAVPGTTRHYQFWYRDSGGVSPCGTAANLTNGVRVDWL